MELKSEEGSLLGYNNNNNNTSVFATQTLDPHLVQQNPKRPSSDQFNGGGDGKIQPKSTGSSGGGGRFRECRKNHAASAGGKVFDGCGEFMPAGDDGLDALRCAACNCHRNFHRKDIDAGGGGEGSDFTRRIILHPLQLPPPLKNHWTPVVHPVKMAYGGGGGGNGGTDSSSEDLNFSGYQSNAVGVSAGGGAPPPPPFVMSKKRFRTKFTAEQKGKMMEYAEKVGWRIPREDDVEVQRFCGEIGVKRQVFKVWMHNNKNSNKKLDQNQEDES